MWIPLNKKQDYNDSQIQGLRVKFDNNVESEIRYNCKSFIQWLRHRYFFPIRCNILIRNCPYFVKKNTNDKKSIADFYYPEDIKIKKIPEIWIAAGINKRRAKINKQLISIDILRSIAHELTHYYQWYFFEYDHRTNRSLENEATRWANYLIFEYQLRINGND